MTESYGAGQEPLQDLDDVNEMSGNLILGTSGGLEVDVTVPSGLSSITIYGGSSSTNESSLGSGTAGRTFKKTGLTYTAGSTYYVKVTFDQGTRTGVTLCASGSVSRGGNTSLTLKSSNCT